LDELQVKNAKANHTHLRTIHHKLKETKRQSRKGISKEKLNQNKMQYMTKRGEE